jgi:hypothetical protein
MPARHDSLVSLVDRMLALHKQLPEIRTPHEKTALASGLIEATEWQIDGGPALWADGGGDRDCRGSQQALVQIGLIKAIIVRR